MALKPVTDEAVLSQLNTTRKPVTDPEILAQLEGPSFERSKAVGSAYLKPQATGPVGVGEAFLNLGSSAIAAPLSGLAGMAGSVLPGDEGQGADWTQNVQNALTYQPRTQVGQDAAKVLAYPFEKIAQGADYLGDVANAPSNAKPRISATAANYGLDPMQDTRASQGERAATAALVNTAIQSVPALLLSRGSRPNPVGRGVETGAKPATSRTSAAAQQTPGLARVSEKPPTIEELSAASTAAYKRAREAGVVVSDESFGTFKQKVSDAMKEEGIDPSLHPDSTAALKRLSETEGAVSLQQLETLRKIANDAQGSVKPADKRLAGQIVDEIDDFIDNLSEKDVNAGDPKAAAAFKEARGLYSRKKKAEEIQQLIHRAELSTPNFSASGMENALRTEFRVLAKNEKKMRRFNAEERAAIEKVAKGGSTENALRMLGKFAPTGPVSGVLSGGAGFMAGGPVGAVALPTAGLLGRYAATQMTLRNAQAAQELMRRGAPVPPPFNPKAPPSLLYGEESRGIF
jgi:hypothetical protein